MENSYLSIAKDDYESMKILYEAKRYNHTVVLCQQACEKLLKSIIELTVDNCKSLLHSHNLRKLFDEVEGCISLPEEMIFYLGTLSDFYIDTRYPGDNYIKVTERDLNMSVKITEHLLNEVTRWHASFTKKNTDFDSLLEAAKLAKPTE